MKLQKENSLVKLNSVWVEMYWLLTVSRLKGDGRGQKSTNSNIYS